jgi:Protein of unknown function (DUF1360)
MTFYWFLLGVLCVWRLTHLLVAEDGPWRLAARLREAAAGRFGGGLLNCFYCLSLWIAVPIALLIGETLFERVLLWPALSGAAILLERATLPAADAAPALYAEDKENSDGMLR